MRNVLGDDEHTKTVFSREDGGRKGGVSQHCSPPVWMAVVPQPKRSGTFLRQQKQLVLSLTNRNRYIKVLH